MPQSFFPPRGFVSPGGEWFKCGVKGVELAILSFKRGAEVQVNRHLDFKMRPE